MILLLKTAAAPVRRELRTGARRELNALWKPTVERFAVTRQQQQVIARGARSKVGSDSFQMLAATSRRQLSGGLDPSTQWQGPEIGASPRVITVQYRGKSRKQVKGNNFPRRAARGQVAYRAARETGPRIVAAWVNGIVRGLAQGNKDMETR